MNVIRRLAFVVMLVAASWFYVTAAKEHAVRVNLSKARADQSGYLWDAENVFHNWHGREPKALIGERNRMPVYAGYLALFYYQGLSDPDYFEVAKVANIYLSLGLLYVIGFVAWTQLPRLPALNLTAIAMFGLFIYKAGYSQSELLFSFFMFLTVLGCWHWLRERRPPGWRLVALAAATGAIAGVAHLTKAAMPPFVALFLATVGAKALFDSWRERGDRRLAWRAFAARGLAIGAFVVTFLAVLSPYLATNKRVFGHYFYNVNSNFYVWYDDWSSASVGVRLHGDSSGWPQVPESEMPSAGRYWREHTVAQIVERVGSGLENLAIVSYRTYDYLPFLLLYVGAAIALAVWQRRAFMRALKEDVWLAGFLVAYAVVYLLAIGFYFPISGTGTARFFVPHLLPLFFALSRLLSSEKFRGLMPFHLAVTVILALDVVFRTHERLLTTYGGF